MTPFIGREKELHRLRAMLGSGRSEFVAVYGRRRVGKTLLIRKAYNDKFTFRACLNFFKLIINSLWF